MKRLFKLLVSAVVWAGGRFVRRVRALLTGRPAPGTCVFLYYHAVPDDMRARFARQMERLARIGRPVPASISGPLPAGKHHIAVTFDDAYQCVARNALPEMRERKIPATVFVPTAFLGLKPDWIPVPEHPLLVEKVMTADEIAGLRNPLIIWGSHGVTHPNFTRIDDAAAERELSESRATLESITGLPVTLFCFPFGAHDRRSIALAQRCGYARVFTTLPRTYAESVNGDTVGRVAVEPSDWLPEFYLKAAGAYRWLPTAFAAKRMLRRALHLQTGTP